jgi:hypothetical protein
LPGSARQGVEQLSQFAAARLVTAIKEIEVIADDIVMIGNGRIVSQGAKTELLHAAGTVVRAADLNTLQRVPGEWGITASASEDGALRTEADRALVGQIALDAGVALTELRARAQWANIGVTGVIWLAIPLAVRLGFVLRAEVKLDTLPETPPADRRRHEATSAAGVGSASIASCRTDRPTVRFVI